jgi:hypothetical protein
LAQAEYAMSESRSWLVVDLGMSIESLHPESSKEAQWLSVSLQIFALFSGMRILIA